MVLKTILQLYFSDAAHNVGDVSGLLLAFLAFRTQTIKPSKIFSYGFERLNSNIIHQLYILLAFAIGLSLGKEFIKL